MRFIADLHIHSRYSRATSSDLTPENLWRWAQYKGISVIGVGDCIHPEWFKELTEKLEPAEPGFFKLREKYAAPVREEVFASCRGDVRFVLSTEISSIYTKNDVVRKVHNVIILSGLDQGRALQQRLDAMGNIRSDGRPILGMDAKELLRISLECDPRVLFIPAHIWTPWFAVLGSKSGFDSIEECFEELTPHIHALETGLSSDPLMNWRLKKLDPFILVSNSDAHSASRLGREANIFDCEFSYDGMYRALTDKKDTGLKATIEFFPEEGKYHFDGHSACQVRFHPIETRKNKGLCPQCGKPVTVGVMARVEDLADRPEGEKGLRARPYHNLISLEEIISGVMGVGKASKKVQAVYFDMIGRLGPELPLLMDVPLKDIAAAAGEKIAEGVRRMRAGEVHIRPGYDGEYGAVLLFPKEKGGTV